MSTVTRPIPGFAGYSVTSDGRVWSEAKATGVSRHGGIWLKPWLTGGYPTVSLKTADGKQKVYVHRLVALAWVHNPEPERRTHVNHKDGVRANNAHTNLEWCTQQENNAHAYETGLKVGPRRKLTMEQAKSIRARQQAGELVPDLAREFGVTQSTLSVLVQGRTYKDRQEVAA